MAVALTARETHQLARRLLLIQVPLNFRTMQGGGYLFALWPWLRTSEHRSERVKAASGFLNAHPVLAALALGALRKRLEEGDAESQPEDLTQWMQSLCGPLGMIGDALIWDRWKPIVFAAGALVLTFAATPAVWLITALTCLIVYNAPLAYTRLWGICEGYRLGAVVLTALNRPIFSTLRNGLNTVSVLLGGLLLGALFMAGSGMKAITAAQFIVAFALTWLGIRRRGLRWFILPAAAGVALAIPLIVSWLQF
jgi:mannose/fructose/N-acetylgalactosamine-specific phosphotransferase system component IID